MRRARMTIVQQSRERFPVSGMTFHRRLEQSFLDVARHIAPYVNGSLAQQCGKAFVGHIVAPCPFRE
jgi:hypothetical protein